MPSQKPRSKPVAISLSGVTMQVSNVPGGILTVAVVAAAAVFVGWKITGH
jgi:hypothetical protein